MKFCAENIERALHLLWRDRTKPIELRILAKKGTYSGYFHNEQKLVKAAETWTGRGNVYVTLNQVHPDCAARRLNRVEWTKSNESTKDAEIVGRTNIYVDCDPVRISGIASTNEEHSESLATATSIRSFLTEQGLPESALISSGNGHALFMGIDLPTDDEGLVKAFLKALASKFDTAKCKVDTSVYNSSRIVRLPGTLNCKGENLAERPHRLAQFVEAPVELVPATKEQLESLIRQLTPQSSAHSPLPARQDGGIDVAAWLTGLGVEYTVHQKERGVQYTLTKCPFKPDGHEPGGAAIFVAEDGRTTAHCFHEKCDWGWRELRAKLDPDFDKSEGRAGCAEAVKDPHRLARIIMEQFRHPDHSTLLQSDGGFWEWKDGTWKECKARDLRRIITREVKAEFDRNAGAIGIPPFVTTTVANNVQLALSSMVQLVPFQGPGWIVGGGWSTDEILVCKSNIVHVAGFLKGNSHYAMPHTPRLFVTAKLPFDFDPTAPAPNRWLRFLEEVWPTDLDSRKLLQEFFGYCLIPDVRLQKFLMLVGASRGGKGVITEVLSELVGRSNYCSIRLKQFAGRFGLENAIGKSLILVPDATMPSDERAITVVETFKAIVGCDSIDIDRKGVPIITTTIPAKIVISTNNMLGLPDESAALYNRMLVLEFTKSFLGKEDPHLASKLQNELPGILNWAVEGLQRLQANSRFTEPKSGLRMKRRLKAKGAIVASFVQDCCTVGVGEEIETDDLYKGFENYCLDLDIAAIEKPQFSSQLQAAVPSVTSKRPAGKGSATNRPRVYMGIQLLGNESAIDTDCLSASTAEAEVMPDVCQPLEISVDDSTRIQPAFALAV